MKRKVIDVWKNDAGVIFVAICNDSRPDWLLKKGGVLTVAVDDVNYSINSTLSHFDDKENVVSFIYRLHSGVHKLNRFHTDDTNWRYKND